MKSSRIYRIAAGAALGAAVVSATPAHADTGTGWTVTPLHVTAASAPAGATPAPGPANPQADLGRWRPPAATQTTPPPVTPPHAVRHPAPPIAGHHQRARHPQRAASRMWLVGPGDTLSLIAAVHGVTVAQMAARNGIRNPDRICVGQVLHIPAGGSL